MKEDEDELIGLFGGASSGFVESMRNLLDQNGIPSAHISGGYHKMPRPTGLRVRKSDFDKAMKLYTEYKEYYDQSKPKEDPEMVKTQQIGVFIAGSIILVVILVIIIVQFI